MDNNIEPELVNEIHNSNRILHIDGKIKEIVDYLKNWKNETPPDEVIETVIDKLEKL